MRWRRAMRAGGPAVFLLGLALTLALAAGASAAPPATGPTTPTGGTTTTGGTTGGTNPAAPADPMMMAAAANAVGMVLAFLGADVPAEEVAALVEVLYYVLRLLALFESLGTGTSAGP